MDSTAAALLALLLVAVDIISVASAFSPPDGRRSSPGQAHAAARWLRSTATSDSPDADLPPLAAVVNDSDTLRPPRPLLSLPVGSSYRPFRSLAPLTITRLSFRPDLFLLKGFIPHEEHRLALMERAKEVGMETARTADAAAAVEGGGGRDEFIGKETRTGQSVAWVSPFDHVLDARGRLDSGASVARDITRLAADLFLTEADYHAEDVQVARYGPGGRFDLHHDEFGRAVTCLVYLNGVAGTWFPFALTSGEEECGGQGCRTSRGTTEDPIKELTPGRDGVWVAGSETDLSALGELDPECIARVAAGDAVVFYNYRWSAGVEGKYGRGGPVEDWRSDHVGMETDREKWIATNWFRSGAIPDSRFMSNEEWRGANEAARCK